MNEEKYNRLKAQLDSIHNYNEGQEKVQNWVMRNDADNILTSYPNEYLMEQRLVIRRKSTHAAMFNHRHEYIEMVYVLEGEVVMKVAGKEIKMKTGDLCLMNKNVQHASEKSEGTAYAFNFLMTEEFFDVIFMYLFSEDDYISSYIINSLYSKSKKENYLLYHLPDNSFEVNLMEQILYEYYLEKPCSMNEIFCCLLILFMEISKKIGWKDEEPIKKKTMKLQKEVMEYLKLHYKDVTLQSMAEDFCFHPNYLSTLLKMETGHGFKEILNEIRMIEAVNLLCKTEMKGEEIAEAIGFANESYFYKCFKKKYGISPGEYKKSKQNLNKKQ